MMCEACWRNIQDHEFSKKVLMTRPHEIVSRGAGGEAIPGNQFILCMTCHSLVHQIGWVEFVELYDHLAEKARGILGRFWHLEKKDIPGEDTSKVFI